MNGGMTMEQGEPQTQEGDRPRRGHHTARRVVLAVVLVLAAACVAYGVALYTSLSHIESNLSKASDGYQTLTAQLQQLDASGALDTARSVSALTADARSSSNEWIWDVAAVAPVYGQDVKTMRALVGIVDDLTTQATLPVAEKLDVLTEEGVFTSDGSIDWNVISKSIDDVDAMLDAVRTATTVISQCADTVDALPTTHSEKLNAAVANARTNLDSLREACSSVEPGLTSAERTVTLLGTFFGGQ